MPRFFTPAEVSAHNSEADLWLSFLGRVWDVTPLVDLHKGDALLLPIMEAAGRDISSWFDPKTQDVRRYVDPLTTCQMYYTPRGRFVHVPPTGPRSDWASEVAPTWWRDERYQVGLLTAKIRWIRVINTLTSQEQRLQVPLKCSSTPHPIHVPRNCSNTPHLYTGTPQLPKYPSPVHKYLLPGQVCSEETMAEILQRYLRFNSHARSYTWKHCGMILDMSQTLGENNVPDDDNELQHLRLDRDLFPPALLLYFNDDLTVS
ncbi:cytochrome b5 domain-containing protein 1 [Spinachia spinachia]